MLWQQHLAHNANHPAALLGTPTVGGDRPRTAAAHKTIQCMRTATTTLLWVLIVVSNQAAAPIAHQFPCAWRATTVATAGNTNNRPRTAAYTR
jgi:hypothetical protein